MQSIESVLITGANAGLGRECAKQMAHNPQVKKIYLGCRNPEKAETARDALQAETGRAIFEILLMDVSDPESVRAAVENLDQSIDAVVLNAGGMGGREPSALTSDGVTQIFAVNILGHAALVESLLERNLLNSVVIYAGSEAARGIPKMGVARPEMKSHSVEEYLSIADGRKFESESDPMVAYGAIKMTAAMWMAGLARRHPEIRFITMSPGGTTGTNGMDDLPFLQKVFFKYIGGYLMPLFGMMHGVDAGAKRYIDGIQESRFQSGHFYASGEGSPTGPVIDQSTLYSEFSNTHYQDNAYQAIRRLI